MKILFLAHRVPYPPNKGDKIRAFHEIRGLIARGHQVRLLTFADDPADVAHGADLTRLGAATDVIRLRPWVASARALTRLPVNEPFTLAYFGSREMRRRVRRSIAIDPPDRIVVYSSSMMQFVPSAWRTRTIVDLVDIDSEKWREYAEDASPARALVYRLEARRLRTYEERILETVSDVVVSTAREAALLTERPVRPLHALVNGVDAEHFTANRFSGRETLPTSEQAFFRQADRSWIVFTGAMDYRPNVEAVRFFADHVLPSVREHHPASTLVIVGSRPARSVRQLAARDDVIVTGTVADVRPYLSRAKVCVVPLRIARGVQNKLLEAMACARPVVASPQAAASLGARDGEHLLVASGADAFAEAVLLLLGDEELRNRLRMAAREFVLAHHKWQTMLDQFCEVVEGRSWRPECPQP